MIPANFGTFGLPAAVQFGAWRDWHSALVSTRMQNPPDGFPAYRKVWMFRGGLTVSRGAAPAISSFRTKQLIRREPVDHWVVSVHIRGTVKLRTRNETTVMRTGVPFVYSLADEAAAIKEGYDRMQLFLPRDSYARLAASLDDSCGKALETPSGRLLADYMILLAKHLPRLGVVEAERLEAAVGAMVGACLAPSADSVEDARRQVESTVIERVRRAVRLHLYAPSLNAESLCREAGTSRSQLYRLLENEGGVMNYIRRQRLAESFAILGDESNLQPIGKIAEMLCFADASSFSRAFRREFGMTPREARLAGQAGRLPMPRRRAIPDSIGSFVDCLRTG